MKNRFPTRRNGFRSASGSGQALVEMAMILAFGSFLVVLCLGVVEFGKLVYWSIEVSNSAKAGAQYAAQTSGTATDQTGTGIQNAAVAAAPDLKSGAASVITGLTASPTLWCVCTTTGSSNSPTFSGSGPDCSGATCSGPVHLGVTVNTSVTVVPPYKLSLFPSTYTLRGSATQECMQ
jgi:Flp pilus assembly protein TadG